MKKAKDAGQKVTEELKNQLARALADYDNLRKRVDREREEIIKVAGMSLFAKLLPAIDLLKKAQAHLNDDGLNQVVKELEKALDGEDIIKIPCNVGDQFDAQIHEVVEVAEPKDDNQKGKIAEVLSEGWMLKEGQIVRPAKVKVYKVEELKDQIN